MTYPQAIQYLESFINYEKIPFWPYRESLKLERIKDFLATIDNPQDSLRCIHIAGTKGKGSTCAFITYILRDAGYKVGLYTSPHLSDFRERIRILDARREDRQDARLEFEGMISRDEITDLVERLKPAIEKYNQNSKYGPLSFFEVYTALTFLYFKRQKVNFVVLETGLGGRLDATNVVNPLVCAITPVSYEHTQKLGNTLTKIAGEKAGIIKVSQLASERVSGLTSERVNGLKNLTGEPANRLTGTPEPAHRQTLIVISAPQKEEAILVIRERCRRKKAILFEVGKDIDFENIKLFDDYQSFDIKSKFADLSSLRIGLLGRHQVINATVAVGIALALNRFYKIKITLKDLKKGLFCTLWPGRFEIISKNPTLIFDGAQNAASAKALKETVLENFPDKRIFLVLGVSKDKDIKGICRNLLPITHEAILTEANNPRAADADRIEEVIRKQVPINFISIAKTKNVKEALRLASKKANPQDLILVCGSLFVVGEARELLKNS